MRPALSKKEPSSYSLNVQRNFILLCMIALTIVNVDFRTALHTSSDSLHSARPIVIAGSVILTVLILSGYAFVWVLELRYPTPIWYTSIPMCSLIGSIVIAMQWGLFDWIMRHLLN